MHLFHGIVLPVALYCCEIWDLEDCSTIERLHLKFCQYVLRVKTSTLTLMIYVYVDIKCWIKLVNGKK